MQKQTARRGKKSQREELATMDCINGCLPISVLGLSPEHCSKAIGSASTFESLVADLSIEHPPPVFADPTNATPLACPDPEIKKSPILFCHLAERDQLGKLCTF